MTPQHAPASARRRAGSRRRQEHRRRERRQSERQRPQPRRREHRGLRRRERRRFERRRLAAILRTEAVGGALLVAAAAVALIVANTPLARAYAAVRDWRIGPAAIGLDLTVGQWAADGLLALFFFLAGLELKQEFVTGHLRDLRRAVVPVAAAVGGMIAPAVIYVAVTAGDAAARAGWAIPTATDIAFALAVLAVVGRHLPSALRTFLLALAVVDDLLAIIVIAVFFSHGVHLPTLTAAVAAILAFAVVLRHVRRALIVRRIALTVLAVAAWALMLRSGVHATVAGVLMGFTVPVRGALRFAVGRATTDDVIPAMARAARPDPATGPSSSAPHPPDTLPPPATPHPAASRTPEESPTMAGRIDELLRPLSAGIAVPVFAFFAAGVTVGGLRGLGDALTTPIAVGAVAGLVFGKAIGIVATTLAVGHVVRSPLLGALRFADWLGVGMVGGVGFTVSLLIGHLAFAGDAAHVADAQIGVVAGSLLSALLAAAVLGWRSRHYAALARRVSADQRRGRPAE